MKFAIVDGIKTEAYKGGRGICPICGSKVLAYCGDIRIHHWKHKRKNKCDTWGEPETEWHRAWKNNYPDEWQEVTQIDETTSERHIADVQTEHDLVIEFQHSYINKEERTKRENFYNKMVWIVDGTRLKNDYTRFLKSINDFRSTSKEGYYFVDFPEESFPKTWIGSSVPVIFDFKGTEKINSPADIRNSLYCLFPQGNKINAMLLAFSRESFIKSTIKGEFLNKKETLDQKTTPNKKNAPVRNRRSTYYYDKKDGRFKIKGRM